MMKRTTIPASEMIAIDPVPTHVAGDLEKIAIAVKDIKLGGSSARFQVTLFDKANKELATKNVMMEGRDYEGWGIDDEYVIEFVLSKLGFKKLEKASAGEPE